MVDRTRASLQRAPKSQSISPLTRGEEQVRTQIASRASREQLGSLLSNGGTSFPTAPHKALDVEPYEWCISSDVVHFQQLMSCGLGITGLLGADNSGSLIATPVSNSN